jgi:hypothetical protein
MYEEIPFVFNHRRDRQRLCGFLRITTGNDCGRSGNKASVTNVI